MIDPGSEHHNDLPSFTAYAKRLSLSESSTVYVGTRYEYVVASSLSRLGFQLTRTGRQSDRGIDLLGHWHVPSLPSPLRVLLQCKAYNKKLTPANVRELEGSFTGAPAGWQGEGVLGFLATTSPATQGMRDALGRSRLPVGFLQIDSEGKVLQFLWNHEAGQRGLEGLGVTTRFKPGSEGGGVDAEIGLTWKGWIMNEDGQASKIPDDEPEIEMPKATSSRRKVKAVAEVVEVKAKPKAVARKVIKPAVKVKEEKRPATKRVKSKPAVKLGPTGKKKKGS